MDKWIETLSVIHYNTANYTDDKVNSLPLWLNDSTLKAWQMQYLLEAYCTDCFVLLCETPPLLFLPWVSNLRLKDRSMFFQVCLKIILTCPYEHWKSYWSVYLFLLSMGDTVKIDLKCRSILWVEPFHLESDFKYSVSIWGSYTQHVLCVLYDSLLQITRGDNQAAGSGEWPSRSQLCPRCPCTPPLTSSRDKKRGAQIWQRWDD